MEGAVYHIPAMLKETIEGLQIQGGGVYVDVTFGGGGHSRAILEEIDKQKSLRSNNQEKSNNQDSNNQGNSKTQDSDIQEKSNNQDFNNQENPNNQDFNNQGYSKTQDSDIQEKSNNQDSKNQEKPNELNDGEQGIQLYSFDQDVDALENAKASGLMDRWMKEENETGGNAKWMFVHSNFRYLRNWMDYYGVKEIDGLLADLGVSFHHFDCPERGFSFRFSAPLDMRMNQTAKRTAADIVNGYSEEELAKVLWLYGELKNGRGIAKNICKARAQKPIERTEELVAAALNIPAGKLKPSDRPENPEKPENPEELNVPANAKKDLAKLFQALRIEVNDELGALREMLVAARDLLKPGGRIAILTYHSLEDRLVKNFLRSGNLEGTIEKDFYGNALTPFDVIEKGREATADEVERNPRARSAKLRVAERRVV